MKRIFFITLGLVLSLILVVGAHAERVEYFLDTVNIESSSGVAFGVNKPTKYPGNPVFGSTSWTWDRDVMWSDVLKFSDTDHRLWYSSIPVTGEYGQVYLNYAVSADGGNTFSRPVRNLISYAGNTNNNILLSRYGHQILYNPNGPADQRFLLGLNMLTDTDYTHLLVYKSADGISGWTLAKTVDSGGLREFHGLQWTFDGRLMVIDHTTPNGMDNRRIGVAIANTTDITGSYTFYDGVILDEGTANQKYNMGVIQYGELYLGLCTRFDQYITNRILTTQLYISRNGTTWTQKDANWLPAGANASDWDYGMILTNSNYFVRDGNNERIYYGATKQKHDDGVYPREGRMGYATIGKGRIGQVSGTGTVTSTLTTVSAGEKIFFNTNAAGGSVSAELLDSGNNVVAGYSQGDFTPITVNSYQIEGLWGGASIPAGNYKLKYYLTTATLYGVVIEAATPQAAGSGIRACAP